MIPIILSGMAMVSMLTMAIVDMKINFQGGEFEGLGSV